MHIQIFRSKKNGDWYFRFVARNGRKVAQSEGYKRRSDAVRMASPKKQRATPEDVAP